MSPISALYSILGPLVGNRVFPRIAPAGTATPYIVYQKIGGESVIFMERASPSKKNARFQITVWDARELSVESLSNQIEVAMVAASVFDAKPLGDASDATADDPENPEIVGARQDFSVWYDR